MKKLKEVFVKYLHVWKRLKEEFAKYLYKKNLITLKEARKLAGYKDE